MTGPLPQLQTVLAGRYAVERELGRGGMATVYLAQDLKHHRPVALKVLHAQLAAVLGTDRFLREIETAANLNHPHILPLFDSGEAAGLLWYAMPLVEGESLRDRLDREQQLPLDDALQIAREVADALGFAHSRGIIHRDIKPENILLAHGHALVADFGIARAVGAAGGAKLTETGLAIGTPSYMSPEQALSQDVDGRSDIYALGCVLYEMLVGEPPYTGPTAQAIIARRLSEPLPSLRVVRETVPLAVEQAVAKALARTPADRFATAGQFGAALLTSMEGSAPVEDRKKIWRHNYKWALPVLAVVAASVVVWFRGRSGGIPVVPAASVIAVLPPAPVTPDTALARLGQNLVVTLSANLNGVGDLRTIDALTVLAQTQGRAVEYTTLDQASALGRRLGATGIVSGTLARDGPNVRLDLGLYATADATPVARAFVTAPPDDINALTDSATWALLRQVWRAGEPPTPSLAAVTTASFPALRAFLDGERAIVEDRWPDAELAFGNAVQEDSTFWLAHWRLAYTRGWMLESLDSAALAPARIHASQLPEPERLLMEAWDADGVVAHERGRVLTERYPDYWPGWLERADRLFHVGPLFGHPIEEARLGLERTLELNPKLKPVWPHLMGVARTLRDAALLDRAIRSYAGLGGYSGADSMFAMQNRTDLAVLQGKPFTGALADSFLAFAVASRDPFQQKWWGVWFSSFGYPALQIEFGRRVLGAGALPAMADVIRHGTAVAWAARGEWDSAVAGMDVYVAQSSDSRAVSRPYLVAVLGVWLGGLEPEVALTRRAALMDHGGPTEGQKPMFAWLDGLLAIARQDSAGLREARSHLTSDHPFARSLSALGTAPSGNRRAAADSLAAMAYNPSDWGDPTVEEVNRLTAARWLAADGDLDRAAALLFWPQASVVFPDYWLRAVVLDGVTYLELARIEEARGDVTQALRFYREFLLRYDHPNARLRPLVEEAQGALARLEGPEPVEQGQRP